MQYSTLIRKKDKSYQYIITYKLGDTWKTKSKQGFALNKDGKHRAQVEMDKAADELKTQLENDIDVTKGGVTFKQFKAKYIEHMKLYREPNTIYILKAALNHCEKLYDIELDKITNIDIQSIVDDLIRSGVSAATISSYLIKINCFFLSAKNEYHLISKLPTENIVLKKDKDPRKSNKRALNKNESNKILEDLKNSKYYLIILLALKCGLRLGEILGLTWDNVDTKNAKLNITQQWKQFGDRSYAFGSLKGENSYRTVPIPAKVNVILGNIAIRNMNGRLFDFQNTDSVSICINRLLRLKGYNITVHGLRHTYATDLISNGIDFKTAAQLLGHDVKQTMNTYSHVTDDMFKKATEIIDNIF